MKTNVYQIFYLDEQLPLLDPAFVPWDNRNNPLPALREWPMIREQGPARAAAEGADAWGFVSYKFKAKTNTEPQAFIDFIRANPHNDVWFMEPQPRPAWPWPNCWAQGDVYHQGITQLGNEILRRGGLNVNLSTIKMPWCFYNFYVGRPSFWKIYFDTIDELIRIAKSDPRLDQAVFEVGAGHGNDPTVPYFIFLVERMFPTILALNGKLRAKGMPYGHVDFTYR
jgi:hypothetical protein